MEFVLNTNLETSLPAVIDFNFEQLKTELRESLLFYNGLVVTEDGIKAAKDDRAKLNKLKTAIDDKRKDVKKQWNAPLAAFEQQTKELAALIDEPISAIDKQTIAFENAEKESKRAKIAEFYDSDIRELRELVPLETLFHEKWLNKTCAFTAVVKELHEAIEKARNDVKVLRAMNLPCEAQMLDAYFRTLDIGAALAEKHRFEEQSAKIAQITRDAVSEPTQEILPVATAPEAERAEEQTSTPTDCKTIKVIFYDTLPEFRQEMSVLCKKHGIKYGGIR